MKKYCISIPPIVQSARLFLALLAAAAVFGIAGCGSSEGSAESRTADDIYGEAMEEFNDDDYLEAQKLFDVIKLQYPASQYADDAQYYMAEINFKKGEYVLAAFNYNLVRRAFPTSPFAKDALYRASLSYYMLSPDAQRDQSYTKQAIQSFAEFQTFYPNDSLASEAGKHIVELRETLAQRDFETAELYVKMEYPKAALIYYDLVINDYSDTKLLEPAYFGKLKMLVRLKRINEARETMRLYRQQFPSGQHLEEINQLIAGL